MALRAKDIAEMLGVSTAAVSLVLNNKPGVGERKRREIINKIEELGCEYMLKDVPANNGHIGFVVFKREGRLVEESPFFNYILEGITGSISKYGYNMNFLYLNYDMPRESQEIQLKAAGCDGFIIFGVEMKREDLQVFIDTGLPFTVLDNSFMESDVDSVAINNVQGTSKAITHLYDMGHRNIGYICCNVRANSFEERFQTYVKTLEQLGLEVNEENIISADYSEREVRAAVRRYLKSHTVIPTAFFGENDFLACSAMLEMQEMGYRVPEDISLIGFDDRPIAKMMTPKMTTINVPKDIFGPAAVNLFISRIKNKRENSLKIEIGTNLIVRDSVKKMV